MAGPAWMYQLNPIGSNFNRKVPRVPLRIRVEVVLSRLGDEGDHCESIEAHGAIGRVASTFDDLDRSIKEPAHSFRLGVLKAPAIRLRYGRWATPDSIEDGKWPHCLALLNQKCGRVGWSSSERDRRVEP